jgi:hypothetical protein
VLERLQTLPDASERLARMAQSAST